MHYQTLQRRFSRLTGRITMIGALSLLAPTLQAASFSVPVTPPSLPIHHFWDDLQLDFFPGDAWERLRKSLAWQDRRDDARVQEWIERFRAQPHSIATIIERARPWMAWITEQVERRNLPGEVSLIPFIESAYDPKARNPSGAAGLWQFMPRTAEALGLQRHTGYDGRLDVVAATYAALDYIELQAEQWYEGDIELSLAAYNAGAGTVNRARHAAMANGAEGDYWELQLPRETMQYLPKLNAIAAIIEEPDAYGITLPEIDDEPAFAKVPVERAINLAQLASATGLDTAELAALNPGLTNGSAHPSAVDVVLVPAEQETRVLAELGRAPQTSPASDEMEYFVQRGDTLSSIAARHDISVAELRQHNGMRSDLIRIGQGLTIPHRRLAAR